MSSSQSAFANSARWTLSPSIEAVHLQEGVLRVWVKVRGVGLVLRRLSLKAGTQCELELENLFAIFIYSINF